MSEMISLMATPRAAGSGNTRKLVTPLNLHIAGAAMLLLLNLYLLTHLFLVWRATAANNAAALQEQTVQMKTAEIAAQSLRGLDSKLETASNLADRFTKARLPYAQSEVLAELGALAKKQGVRLTRGQYGFVPAAAGTPRELTELDIDTSLSGDYRPLVQVVNALERDEVFFLINSVTLTGQQSGTVNLRLRLTTYVRPPGAGELVKTMTAQDAERDAKAASSKRTIPVMSGIAGPGVAPRPRYVPGMPVRPTPIQGGPQR